MRERRKVGEIMVDLRLLTAAQVDAVLDALRRRADGRTKFGRLAREMGLVTEQHVLAALAVQMELFPGIAKLTLDQLLDALLTTDPPAA